MYKHRKNSAEQGKYIRNFRRVLGLKMFLNILGFSGILRHPLYITTILQSFEIISLIRQECLRQCKQLSGQDFGPGVLACATRGGGRSEAGHCQGTRFPLNLGTWAKFWLIIMRFVGRRKF